MRKLLVIVLLTACTTTTTVTPPAPAMSAEVRAKREREHADVIVWLGRRTAYLGNYQEAIDVFTDGAKRYPNDARMFRHRGHRWITLRQFDRAVADLTHAASLIRGREDEVEPDGLPNARNIPTSTLQSNIWYHLGLAHYLRGDFEKALGAYRECMKVSKNPDGVVSTSHWLYMTLRRLGRREEAGRVLDAISTDMDVIENQAYHKLLLMYRGEIAPEELEADVTTQYGVGNWYLYNGQLERARPVYERILAGKEGASFGYIAAEADLHRLH
jgi:tetratricopeptide (TPR) repeat protein